MNEQAWIHPSPLFIIMASFPYYLMWTTLFHVKIKTSWIERVRGFTGLNRKGKIKYWSCESQCKTTKEFNYKGVVLSLLLSWALKPMSSLNSVRSCVLLYSASFSLFLSFFFFFIQENPTYEKTLYKLR
jgi:hypothetical protein